MKSMHEELFLLPAMVPIIVATLTSAVRSIHDSLLSRDLWEKDKILYKIGVKEN